jgi:hypothetical protein
MKSNTCSVAANSLSHRQLAPRWHIPTSEGLCTVFHAKEVHAVTVSFTAHTHKHGYKQGYDIQGEHVQKLSPTVQVLHKDDHAQPSNVNKAQ